MSSRIPLVLPLSFHAPLDAWPYLDDSIYASGPTEEQIEDIRNKACWIRHVELCELNPGREQEVLEHMLDHPELYRYTPMSRN